jgi:hypothetical protein
MHKTILRMKKPVGPMINLEIGTDLIQGIFLACDKFFQVDKLGHRIHLGMKLIQTIPFIYTSIIVYHCCPVKVDSSFFERIEVISFAKLQIFY